MTVDEAARILCDLYQDAEDEKVCCIHLFGIAYADELGDMSIPDVVKRAGIPNSYSSEVSKGRKLGQYVVLNDEAVRRFNLPQAT